MYNQSKIILLSLVLFSSSGCSISRAVNKTLSPPVDTKWVNIEVKNPSQYTKPFPLEVRYISHECMKKKSVALMALLSQNPAITLLGYPCSKRAEISGKQKLP